MSTDDESASLLGAAIYKTQNSTSPNGVSRTMDRQASYGAVTTVTINSVHDCLTSEGVTLSWENVSAFAPQKSQRKCCGACPCCRPTSDDASEKQILYSVSGLVKPGTLLAILGASGAGKTTLLNVLNQRNIRKLRVNGDLRVNGTQLGSEITAISGYVQQDDVFIGRLTVREHLWFQAMLRMDRGFTPEERVQRVEEVIQELGLTKCADTPIGTPGKVVGISGGERKRLAFASEVLTNPSLMFCDEPTSGLDSFMAESVVKTLGEMASKGKTVICTIHQPSSQVYSLFDRVLLMAEGRVAYMGTAAELNEFFGRLDIRCPPSFNPADFYIHALAVVPGREDSSRDKIQMICDSYKQSPQFDELKNEFQKVSGSANRPDNVQVKSLQTHSIYRATCWTQFWVLLWRAFVTNMREPVLSYTKLINTLAVAVIFGLIYLDQTYDQKGIMNINGALFLLQAQMSFSSVFPVVNTFIAEFPVFMREHHNGMYKTAIYYITKILAELPIYLIIPIVFSCIAYWMIGLYRELITFLIATGTLLLVCNCAVSYGYLLSCMSSNLNLVLALSPILLVPLMLFGGLFLNTASIPSYFIWFRYISWFSYSNEILVVNQWRNVDNITCDTPHFNSTFDERSQMGGQCFRDGKAVINSLSFSEDNLWIDFVCISSLLVGFRILSFIILYLRARRRD